MVNTAAIQTQRNNHTNPEANNNMYTYRQDRRNNKHTNTANKNTHRQDACTTPQNTIQTQQQQILAQDKHGIGTRPKTEDEKTQEGTPGIWTEEAS